MELWACPSELYCGDFYVTLNANTSTILTLTNVNITYGI